MGVVEDKIKAMGHSLPEPFKFPNPNRTGCVVVGSIVFASGHGRNMGGPGVKGQGKLGKDLTVEEGYATARAVALSMLASLKQELGDLDRIKRVVRLFGMVNVAPGFDRMPEVIAAHPISSTSCLGQRPASMPARLLAWPSCRMVSRWKSMGSSSSRRNTSANPIVRARFHWAAAGGGGRGRD
jgi:hypothetical protein